MGILVPEANLPMGITVSNVYVSFSGEVIYTIPGNGQYRVNTHYKVYKDETKQPDTNIRIPISTQVSNISIGVYTALYEELKRTYQNFTDVLDIPPSNRPDGMSEEQYAHWQDLVNRVSLYISENPGHTDLEDAYNAVENSFLVLRSSDITNLEHLETLYNSLI